MKRLFIVGAGGFGREVLAWASAIAPMQQDWEISGFLDSNPAALAGMRPDVQILGDPLDYQFGDADRFVCAIGDPDTRMRLCLQLQERGATFVNLIHPTAIVGPGCLLGRGVILCPYSVLSCDVSVGDYVAFNVHSGAGHDAVIGDGCTISAHCDITGHVRLGRRVFVGSHASILPGVTVGDHSVIGAGSVVLRDVKVGSTVMGVPARVIVERDEAF